MSYKQIDNSARSDQELLSLILNDDKDAFKELFHKYYKQVSFLVSKLISDEVISLNIIHDVFLEVWNNRHQGITSPLNVHLFALTCTKIYESLNNTEKEIEVKTTSPREWFIGLFKTQRLALRQ
ncbi:hypothetical protein LPB86_05225 [Pedobacter sp. MC2016-14]|uniref:RNA polymerase sigma factor n=1 Tax=Pedobacter sp. MC2016-14 TaxID=2897327 RepID=UPI001E3A67EC|nr:hypothetical protein [Pedobacter sp. MC2016-14]MCD0487618.1 hypothetical protein [Pedobacter sp. MC2016-14]